MDNSSAGRSSFLGPSFSIDQIDLTIFDAVAQHTQQLIWFSNLALGCRTLLWCHSYQLSPSNQESHTIFDKGETLP